MLLHLDGSTHAWFADQRRYDLLVVLDDATSEIYYAQLVEQESTRTVLQGLREVVRRQGVFRALYCDRASHFFETPKAGGKIDPQRVTQVGRAMRELGIRMIPAYSPQARERSERSFGTWQGPLPQELRVRGITMPEAANRFLREEYIAEFNHKFRVAAAQPAGTNLSRAAGARGEPRQHRADRQSRAANSENAVARHLSRKSRRGVRAPGRYLERGYGPHTVGRFNAEGMPLQESIGKGCGKAAPWKPKSRVPTALGNPAKGAGFPLSHTHDDGGSLTCTGKRTPHVLQKPDIFTCQQHEIKNH
jgi:hypothetical protein